MSTFSSNLSSTSDIFWSKSWVNGVLNWTNNEYIYCCIVQNCSNKVHSVQEFTVFHAQYALQWLAVNFSCYLSIHQILYYFVSLNLVCPRDESAPEMYADIEGIMEPIRQSSFFNPLTGNQGQIKLVLDAKPIIKVRQI